MTGFPKNLTNDMKQQFSRKYMGIRQLKTVIPEKRETNEMTPTITPSLLP